MNEKALKSLSSGRSMLICLVGFGLLSILGIVLPRGMGVVFQIVGLILITGFGAGLTVFLKDEATRLRKDHRSRERNFDEMAEQLSSLTGLASLPSSPQVKTAEVQNNQAHPESSPVSIFSPGAIAASTVLSKPAAHTAGRIAAQQEMSPDSDAKLATISRASGEQLVRQILWLGPVNHGGTEVEGWNIAPVKLQELYQRPNPTSTYLVLNLSSLSSSVWDNLTSSLNYEKFLRVSNYIRAAKANGTIVVLVPEPSPSHFSGSLRALADIVYTSNAEDRDDYCVSLPLFQIIETQLLIEEPDEQ